VPNPLPVAFSLSDDGLAGRANGSFSNGMEAWPILHGLLLAADVAAFRRWGHEPALDCSASRLRTIRTDCPEKLASITNIGPRSVLLRDLVSLLDEAG
jgi:hypothetical protein